MLRQDEEGVFSLLPNEVVLHIFSFPNVKDITSLMLVSKRFKVLADDTLNHLTLMQMLSMIANSVNTPKLMTAIHRWREGEFYQSIKAASTQRTPYETIFHALITDNIYEIDPGQLEEAINKIKLDIKSGVTDKEFNSILNNLLITRKMVTLKKASYRDKDGSMVGPFNKLFNSKEPNHYLNLSGANFTDVIFPYEVDLGGANLENANFYMANLKLAYLVRAYVRETNFECANISKIYVKDTDLNEARFISSTCFQNRDDIEAINHFNSALNKGANCIICYDGIGTVGDQPAHQYYGFEHETREAIANDIASQAWQLAQENKELALALIDFAIFHPIFKHRNFALVKSMGNYLYSLYTKDKDPAIRSSSQNILIEMREQIKSLSTVELDHAARFRQGVI